jgi:flagellar motor switch protein FliN/FliY
MSNTPFGIESWQTLWAETIASVLGQLTGAQIKSKVTAAPDSAQPGHWITFTLGGALAGEHALWISSADSLHLSQAFMGEPVDPKAEFTADHQDALPELVRQFAGGVAPRLKSILGAECAIQFKDQTAPAALSGGKTSGITLSTNPEIVIFAWSDTGLLNVLAKRAAADADAQTAEEQEKPAAVLHSAPPAHLSDKNLDLLLDLELDVSIRFGRRQMALKDVLDLSAGAVVELDRQPQDPIELILGGKVIARGEAVVIDGNYGIRIFEVLTPAQRLAHLA